MQMDADKREQTVSIEVTKRINQFLCLYFLHPTLNSIHIHLRSSAFICVPFFDIRLSDFSFPQRFQSSGVLSINDGNRILGKVFERNAIVGFNGCKFFLEFGRDFLHVE